MKRHPVFRLRLPLKYLLLLMTLLTVAMGWWARSASLQRRAATDLEQKGFSIGYASVSEHRDYPFGMLPLEEYDQLPSWIKRVLDRHFFVPVIAAANTKSTYASIDISSLRHLREMRSLSLQDVAITDEDLAVLRSCRGLENLSLIFLDISDQALAHVSRLPKLKHITLRQVRVTDRGLRHLQSLHQLQRVEINGTYVSKRGADQLRKWLPECDITWWPTSEYNEPPPIPYRNPNPDPVYDKNDGDLFGPLPVGQFEPAGGEGSPDDNDPLPPPASALPAEASSAEDREIAGEREVPFDPSTIPPEVIPPDVIPLRNGWYQLPSGATVRGDAFMAPKVRLSDLEPYFEAYSDGPDRIDREKSLENVKYFLAPEPVGAKAGTDPEVDRRGLPLPSAASQQDQRVPVESAE